MNLANLFEMQKVLRDRIDYNKPDRFNKLILALLVELGECANEWRGFKFWSKNQYPQTGLKMENGEVDWNVNPLLEEYVDGLHFVLELGIERKFEFSTYRTKVKHLTITEQFNTLFRKISDFDRVQTLNNYIWVIDLYIGLGEMLGFTWEQVKQAYISKNEINHLRQDNGY